jgi:hypothetical protein
MLVLGLAGVVLAGFGAPAAAQANPPWVSIPASIVTVGEVTNLNGGGFAAGSVVTLTVSATGSGTTWSRTVAVDGEGKISYPLDLREAGMHRVDVIGADGTPLTMLMVSAGIR